MENKKIYRIGLDVGGTKIAAVLLDARNRVLEHSILATPKDSLEHFLIMMQAAVDPLLTRVVKNKGTLSGIGLGIPGPIDYEKGEVVVAANLAFLSKKKIGQLLQVQLQRPETPVILDNDANCFVRAEARLGAGVKSNNFYGLTIGTGIGGAWWHNGEVYRGHHGAAGEPGHLIIDIDHHISLETAYQKLMQSNAALIAEEAYRGDILARQRFEEIGANLGVAFSTIVDLLDPEMIIIGGGVLAASDLFLDAAKENMKKYIFSQHAKSVKLVKGKVGPLAGAIGAALLIK
jgi:glucokinase